MKLYIIKYPADLPTQAPTDLAEIRLGSEGRGRTLTVVPVMGDAGDSYRPARTPEGLVLMRGDWPEDGRCLCVINTQGAYDRYRSYGLFDASGVIALAEGYHAFGEAGNLGSQTHVLAVIEDGAEFRLNSKYASHWYRWLGGQWLVESPSQRKARLAIESVARGEVEWI